LNRRDDVLVPVFAPVLDYDGEAGVPRCGALPGSLDLPRDNLEFFVTQSGHLPHCRLGLGLNLDGLFRWRREVAESIPLCSLGRQCTHRWCVIGDMLGSTKISSFLPHLKQ